MAWIQTLALELPYAEGVAENEKSQNKCIGLIIC